MSRRNKYRSVILWVLISSFTFIHIFSCLQKKERALSIAKIKDKPPDTIIVKSTLTLLDTCPPPRTIAIPKKPGGSYNIKLQNGDHRVIELLPPVQDSVGYLIPTQNYNTEQGLAQSVVLSSYEDKKGNLWFGTQGEGVSCYDGKAFRNFGTSQGLASSIVLSILEDKKGNLWFGTTGGLSCYNGRTFKTYDTKQGLTNNVVLKIFYDQSGNLWALTQGGISILKANKTDLSPEQARFIGFKIPGAENDIIYGIAQDKKGSFWFCSDTHGAFSYDGKKFTNYTTVEGLAGNLTSCVLADTKGNIWLATYGKGVSCFNGQAFTNYNTENGLINNNISKIFEDKSGGLWFMPYYEAGVSRLDPDRKNFTTFDKKRGMPMSYVTDILQDKNENIWFSTWGGGISRFFGDGKSLVSYTREQGLITLSSAIFEDKAGNIWFGSQGDGVIKMDTGRTTAMHYTTAQGLVWNWIDAMLEDQNGNIWFGTNGGLSRLDSTGRFFTNYTTTNGLSDNTINKILQEGNRSLWFATANGISMLDANRKYFRSYATNNGLASSFETIIEDKEGNFWFGSDSGILYLNRHPQSFPFDKPVFTRYTKAQGLPDNQVECALEDKAGNIWFGSMGGLSRFDGNSFVNYSIEDGLGDNSVQSIIMDPKGVIWMTTNRGITALKGFARNTKAKPDILPEINLQSSNDISNTKLADENIKPVFEVYNNKTGYSIKDIFNNSLCQSHDGSIWAGTSEKVIRFDYKHTYKSNNPPVVNIQNIKVDNEDICWYDLQKNNEKTDSITTSLLTTQETGTYGKKLTDLQRDSIVQIFNDIKFDSIIPFYNVPVNLSLPYQQNNITFEFAAIEPARPNLVRYQYMLEGYDKDWNPVTDKTIASFGNMYEGNYTFRLKAQSPDGIWSNSLNYTFRVLPPWYRTWWAYTLYIFLFLLSLWSFIKWREQKLKGEKLILEEKISIRTHQLKEEKEKVESTLSELKSTQAQLIQSEKMASLGELTAGIAHEIQNPLNFVNNFSEVNAELIEELQEERKKENRDFKNEDELISNLKENEQKINHHGKRADSIVKGMLQHSRSSSGKKEPTDINALADEYLRLSYHGMRAKDKLFNATLQKDFDESLSADKADVGKINIISQDIGRVLLNLFNNAFYAINEKKRMSDVTYTPAIFISTKKINDKVEIKVKDNGIGIPQKVLDKIFQPFFTTKPTGQGTGLGLSLSYDIIKAHGGEIKVETKEKEGAEFKITLPIA